MTCHFKLSGTRRRGCFHLSSAILWVALLPFLSASFRIPHHGGFLGRKPGITLAGPSPFPRKIHSIQFSVNSQSPGPEEDPEVRPPSDDAVPRERPFEICHMQGDLQQQSLEIDECIVLEATDAQGRAELMEKQARLLFELDSESELLTYEEIEQRAKEWGVPVPEAVRLHALGVKLSGEDEKSSSNNALYHMHFGAGRLGLGLVVPALCGSGIPFAVVQRPKRTWSAVFDTGPGFIDITVNNKTVAPNLARRKTIDLEEEFPHRTFLCSDKPETLGHLLRMSTSFSCSLGAAMPKVLKPMFEQLPTRPREEQPVLYACENDHQAVQKLKRELEGRVLVVDCMVDRICTGRTISADAINIEAEPWGGSLVVLDPSVKRKAPFCKSIATVPSTQLEADYYSERKFSLVNGMHAVLSFMTLRRLYNPEALQEYILLKHAKMPAKLKREVRAWVVARIAQLIEKYGIENIMQWHGCSTEQEAFDVLLDYAYEVLDKRFSQTDDVVSRVLGGGVANRWLTRMRPTQLWLEKRVEKRTERGTAAKEAATDRIFVHAGFGSTALMAEDSVREICTALLRESRRFCTREIEILNTKLIRMQREYGGKKNSPFVVAALRVEKELQKEEMVAEVDERLHRDGPVALLFNLNGTVIKPIIGDISEAAILPDTARGEPLIQPAPHCKEMLTELKALGQDDVVVFALATDTPKASVPLITHAAGLHDCFPTESIHSAFSDFEAPRMKPDPSVYKKAAQWTQVPMSHAIAVDSSPDGIVAASRAGVSLIVGYIGTKFDSDKELYEFANQLLKPNDQDRGAALVIDDLRDIAPIVAEFASSCSSEHWEGDPAQLAAVCKGNVFLEFFMPAPVEQPVTSN